MALNEDTSHQLGWEHTVIMTGPRRLERETCANQGWSRWGKGAHKKITFALNFVLVGGEKKKKKDNSSFRGYFPNNVNNLLTDLGVK